MFLLLYEFASCIFHTIDQKGITNNKKPNEESTANIEHINQQFYNYFNPFIINVNETSYFRPLKIDLNKITNDYIYFRSSQGTQYVFLSGIDTLINKSILFESIFVSIDSNKLEVFNLTLVESPVYFAKGPITIHTSYLTSDFLSISANYISFIDISQQFNVLENDNAIDLSNEQHAKIILQESAKYSLLKPNSTIWAPQKPIDSEKNIEIISKNSYLLNQVKEFLEEDNNDLTSIYFLNSSVEKLNIYNKYVIAVFPNSTLNLTSNSTNEIHITTSSPSVDVSLLESPSYRNHIILDLFLTEICQITFDPSFDLITNSFILGDIRIHHSKELTAVSITSVPYVLFIPIEMVTFIPERHNSENYCLCLKSRLETCIENNECLLYHVNKSNYFHGTNSSFLANIARSNTNIINIYVTQSQFNSNDYHIVALRQSSSPGKVYNFISTNSDIETFLTVQDSAIDQTAPIDLSFTDITRVNIEAKTGVISTLSLKNSPTMIEKSFSVMNLVTDLISLSPQQTESLTVTSLLTLSPHASLTVISIDLILAENSKMEIKEISYFPYITFSTELIDFSDGDNDFNVRIQGDGPITIEVEDSLNDRQSIIDIRSANSNIQLEALIIFNLVNPLSVSFLNAFPLPEKVEFYFKPLEDELSSLFLILPYDGDDGPGHRYNFGNITGNLNLILLTPETIFTFIHAFSREDFNVSGITSLSLNVMDIVDSVTLYEESVFISSIYGVNLHLEKDFVKSQITVLMNTTSPFVLSLGSENMQTVYPIVIESTTSNTTIFFDDTFNQLLNFPTSQNSETEKNDIFNENILKILDSIIIRHHTFNVTLKTNLASVPMVEVDDDVKGVLYVASTEKFEVPAKDYTSFRSGPELVVSVMENQTTVNQDDFLAEKVTFQGAPFKFIAKSKSLVNYTFLDTQPSIDLSKNDNRSWFEAFALNLKRSPVTGANNIIVDYLDSDIFSLSRNSIRNLVVGKSGSISDDNLNNIEIGSDKITLTSDSPDFSTASIRGGFWQIYYGGSDIVNVSITESSLNQEIVLILTNNLTKTINLDKSWFRVSNAERFIIIKEDDSAQLTVRADLMKMPNIVVVGPDGEPIDYNIELYKALYTNGLSFIIFLALVLIILIISIVLMIVGFCRLKKKMVNFEAKQTNKTMLSIPEAISTNENEFID